MDGSHLSSTVLLSHLPELTSYLQLSVLHSLLKYKEAIMNLRGMGRGNRAYGIYGEEGSGEAEIVWNVNKECRK